MIKMKILELSLAMAESMATLTPIGLEALVLKFFGAKRTESPLKLNQAQA